MRSFFRRPIWLDISDSSLSARTSVSSWVRSQTHSGTQPSRFFHKLKWGAAGSSDMMAILAQIGRAWPSGLQLQFLRQAIAAKASVIVAWKRQNVRELSAPAVFFGL